MTDYGALLDESRKVPIWEGDFKLPDEVNTFWWQTWDTGRMDVGLRAMVGMTMAARLGPGGVEEVPVVQGKLIGGMVGSLVAPALSGAEGDWSVEVKMPEVVEKESKSGGRPYWSVSGKLVVRCAVAKELELLINAVNRFAQDSEWDGACSRERWAARTR